MDTAQAAGFLGIPYDGWVALFTAALTVATIVMGIFTYMAASAAKKAADALPILERAYVYPRLISDSFALAVASANAATIQRPDDPPTVPLGVSFAFKNFGKTPARLVSGEVELHRLPPDGKVTMITDWPVDYMDVLGDGEAT